MDAFRETSNISYFFYDMLVINKNGIFYVIKNCLESDDNNNPLDKVVVYEFPDVLKEVDKESKKKICKEICQYASKNRSFEFGLSKWTPDLLDVIFKV